MNQDKGLSLHLPPVGETKEVKDKNILNVWINARDQVAFFENDQLTTVPSSELKDRIESRLNENQKLIISVKTERGATYRTFVDVLDELKMAGATKISIANPEE